MENFTKFKKDALKDKEVKRLYDELKPEFDLIADVMQKRIEKGLTQRELAQKMGTKQSAISRFESGGYNPSLAFLRRIADALDARLEVAVS
ncbi:MAG: helix-turn-helix transcriptional regulator [Patescibacteria group bacterium]